MLPKQLNFGTKVESAPARSYRTNIAPQNGTGPYSATGGDTIIINIPTRNNLVMVPSESYLKFDHIVRCSDGSTANEIRWDSCGAHGLIQRIRIYHGSNLLQDIDNYGLLAKFLFDLQVPTDAAYGKLNILAGTRGDLKLVNASGAINAVAATTDVTATVSQATVNAATASIVTNVNNALNLSQVMQINSGDTIGTGLAASAYTTSRTYCLNLISLVGSLCSQNYLPLFACTSSPLRVEIQLTDSVYKSMAISTQTTTTQGVSSLLTNVEYIANFIELSDGAMGMIQGSLQGGPLQFVVPDYRNYQFSTTLANSQAQINMPIAAKFSSLKSLFVMMRDQGTGAAAYFPFSTVRANLTDYYFRLGSTVVPAKAPNTITEFFAELLKAVGSMSDLNHQPAIDSRSYAYNTSASNTFNGVTSSASFYIGLDLENYCAAPKDQIFAGYNSNTDDIYCVLNLAAGITGTVRFDSYALFDTVIIFDNNTVFVKY